MNVMSMYLVSIQRLVPLHKNPLQGVGVVVVVLGLVVGVDAVLPCVTVVTLPTVGRGLVVPVGLILVVVMTVVGIMVGQFSSSSFSGQFCSPLHFSLKANN